MKAPFRWEFAGIAALAILVAVLAGPNEAVAIPAATVAVAAAGLALWDSVRTRSPEPSLAAPVEEAVPGEGTDAWFGEGVMGQEAIVLLLDRIDRALVHPTLPTRDFRELAQLSGLPREEFLGYMESRLAELEAGS